MNKIEKLEEIIRMYDALIDCWLDGERPEELEEDFGCVYELANSLRNEGLKIIRNLKEGLDKLS